MCTFSCYPALTVSVYMGPKKTLESTSEWLFTYFLREGVANWNSLGRHTPTKVRIKIAANTHTLSHTHTHTHTHTHLSLIHI